MLKRLIKSHLFLLILILVGGFVVRLYKINSPLADWHSWRQADTASVTRIYLDEGIDVLHPRYYDVSSIQTGVSNPEGLRFVEFPIYNVIHALLVKNVGKFSLEMWGRLLSVISSVVSIAIVFLIGRRISNAKVGLLASFFFAFMPYSVYFSRVVLPEPMATSLGLLGIFLFIKFVKDDSTLGLYFSGVSFALSILIKPFTIFYLVVPLYLLFEKYKTEELLRFDLLYKLLVFGDLIFVPFILWRGWMGKFTVGIPHWKWAFNGDHIRFRPAFWRWIFVERIGKLFLGVWGLVPFVFGLLKSAKVKFYLYFFGGLVLYMIVFATANVRHDYYQTYLIPAVSLLLAVGSFYLWNTKEFNKYFARVLLVFSVLMMLLSSSLQVKEFYKINHPEIIEAGAALDSLAPKDARVVAPYNGDTAFLYHTKRFGWPVIDTSLVRLMEAGADYFVTVNLQDPDYVQASKEYREVVSNKNYAILDLGDPL